MGPIKILGLLGLLLAGIAIPAEARQRDTMTRTQPAYNIALLADRLDSSECKDDLLLFREAIDRRILWALRVLDSSGSPKPGFTYGNNFWLGSRSQCDDTVNSSPLKLAHHFILNNTRYRNPQEETAPFDVRYFVAYATHNSTLQYHVRLPDEDMVTLGLCLPASCSTGDISGMLKRIFHNRTLLLGELYSADLKLVEVRDLLDDHRWLLSGKMIFFVIVVLTLVVLMISGTVYDMTIHQNHLRMKQESLLYENNNTTAGEVKCNNAHGDEGVAPPKLRSPTLPEELLMCFSIYTNTKKIFDTNLGKNSVPCVHGMKFMGMFWIIMAHAIYFLTQFVDNKPFGVRVQDNFLGLLLSNATYSVDTFLFLSGFLAAYVYWSATMRNDDPKRAPTCSRSLHNVSLMIIKRYLRITPAYMLLLGFNEMNALWYSKTAIFAVNEHELCSNYWWRNMLYINNLFDWDKMCMRWSWYLAVDVQFYVMSVILLVLSSMYFYTAAIILGLLLIGSMIISGYVSYSLKFVYTFDEQHHFLEALYQSPWTRFGPYAVGIILAFFLVKFGSEIHLTKKTVFVGWCLSFFCNMAVICGIRYDSVTVISTAFYMALSRTAWGLGIAWVVFACRTNNAGVVNKLLSFKGFIPLSRLTYCAYLVNPFIIQSIYLSGESAVHLDILASGVMSFGLVLASYLSAYILCLMVEMPAALLINVLTKPRRQRK